MNNESVGRILSAQRLQIGCQHCRATGGPAPIGWRWGLQIAVEVVEGQQVSVTTASAADPAWGSSQLTAPGGGGQGTAGPGAAAVIKNRNGSKINLLSFIFDRMATRWTNRNFAVKEIP